MTLVRGHLAAAIGVFRRDLAQYLSYRIRFVTQLLSIAVSLTLFYYVSRLVSVGRFPTPDAYYAFVVVGILIFNLVASTLQVLPASVRQELVAGTFERFILSPFGAVAGIVSMMLFPFAMAIVMSVVMIAFATLVFGVELRWETVPLAIPIGFLGTLAFAPFALLLTAVVVAFKQAPGAGFILAGISLVAGLYFPVELLPQWISWMSEVQPFTPTTELLRNVLVGTPLTGSVAENLGKVTGFAVLLFPLAMIVLRIAFGFGQRRGTVIEY